MSAKNDNLKLSDTEQFSDLQSRLESQVDDETVLAEIHVAIKELLTNNNATESRIREILQRRFDSGDLRPESFELVNKMLDRINSENVASPAVGAATLIIDRGSAAPGEVPYVDTEVIGDEMPVDVPAAAAPFTSTTVLDDDVAVETMTDAQLQIGTILRDRFLLQQQVFGGSTGVVYKALDQRLADAGDENTFVAIKVLPAEVSGNDKALRALQQEVAKGRCLTHQNIVRCIDLDREDEMHFIIMEWLDGKSLAAILDEAGTKKIDLETTMDIIKQLSQALEYAHKRGVVHGDVNPGNIKITREGEVKLFDFGIARVLQKEQDSQPDFDPRELGAKSPEYSSMQVLTGEDPVPADDVFSLGCLMYRLIAGYRVFGPRSAAEAASEGMEPQQPQGLSDIQWSALRKALAYSRVPRFSSPAEFVAAIGDVSKSQPAPEKQPTQAAATEHPTQLAPPQQPAPPEPSVSIPMFEAPEPPAQLAPPPKQRKKPQRVRRSQILQPAQVAQALQPAQPEPTVIPAQEAPLVVPDEPMVARSFEIEDRPSPWRLVILGTVLNGAFFVATQTDIFEQIEQLLPAELVAAIRGEVATVAPREVVAEPIAEPVAEPIANTVAEAESEAPAGAAVEEATAESAVAEGLGEDTLVEEFVDEEMQEETVAESAETELPIEPEAAIVPVLPATLTVGLVATGQIVHEVGLTMREDTEAATIDLVRMHNMREPYTVLLEEVGFTGNRSPWEEGRYELANNGVATFEAGQNRVRTTITMSADAVREADREVTIQVREIDDAESELARINLRLEDDDRRAFEASLPLDTIAFVDSEIFVREADPAVQIDVVRFKPGNTAVEVRYAVQDLTTTAGEDYFPPGLPIIYFSPGQRSARILIPLVQDVEIEGSEVFALELQNDSGRVDPDIYQRIAVMIRDDD
jgi:serine/threonine protein kinase